MSRAKLIVAGVALAAAAGLGALGGASQHTVEYRTITIKSPPEVYTHVETKEVTKVVPVPQVCRDLLRLEADNFEQDKIISKQAGLINQAVQDEVMHMSQNEPEQWHEAEQKIIDAQVELNRALVNKGNREATMLRMSTECAEATKNAP